MRDLINDAQRALGEGTGKLLKLLPLYVKRIIEDDLWRGRTKGPQDDGAPFTSFREFVEYPLWFGLECPWDKLIRYCEDDAECRAMLLEQVEPAKTHQEAGAKGGRGKKATDNNKSFNGDSQQYLIARLKRDNPQLAESVIRGELTAHAAALAAGFRKPTKSIPVDSPESAIRALLRVFPTEELAAAFDACRGGDT
jgi:hypothetical protein